MLRQPRQFPAPDPGDWIRIPLRDGRWGLGRVTSADRQGSAILCYFFAPFDDAPQTPLLQALSSPDAVLVGICGDVGVRTGRWQNLGPNPLDRASEWPLPIFRNRDPFVGRLRRAVYEDGHLLKPVVFEYSDDPALSNAPEDGAMQAGFVEERLTRLAGPSGRAD